MATQNFDEKRPQRFYEIQAAKFAQSKAKSIDDEFERERTYINLYDDKLAQLIENRNTEGHVKMPAQNTVANGVNDDAKVIRYKKKDDVSLEDAKATIIKVSEFLSSDELVSVSSVNLDAFTEKRVGEIYSESFLVTDKLTLIDAGDHLDWHRHPSDCLQPQRAAKTVTLIDEEPDVFAPRVKTISADALAKQMHKQDIDSELLADALGVQVDTVERWLVDGVPATRFDQVFEALQ